MRKIFIVPTGLVPDQNMIDSLSNYILWSAFGTPVLLSGFNSGTVLTTAEKIKQRRI
jgi:hypothetical protein